MVEHSIEELERQWQSARDRARQAQTEVHEAQRRLERARLDATGLAGHIVEGPQWGEHSKHVRIVARNIAGYRNEKVSGPIIKKDGTEGERRGEVIIEFATDLGPFAKAAS